MEDIMPETGKEIEEEVKESEEIEESSSGFKEEEEEKENGQTNKNNEEEEGEGEKRGGIITHIISNLVSPLSPKVGDVRHDEGSCDDLGRSGGGVGGGVMKDIISNLFHHSESEDHESQEIKEENGHKGGIIDNIVSHFPDDAVPTTDEASILIHSIVKD